MTSMMKCLLAALFLPMIAHAQFLDHWRNDEDLCRQMNSNYVSYVCGPGASRVLCVDIPSLEDSKPFKKEMKNNTLDNALYKSNKCSKSDRPIFPDNICQNPSAYGCGYEFGSRQKNGEFHDVSVLDAAHYNGNVAKSVAQLSNVSLNFAPEWERGRDDGSTAYNNHQVQAVAPPSPPPPAPVVAAPPPPPANYPQQRLDAYAQCRGFDFHIAMNKTDCAKLVACAPYVLGDTCSTDCSGSYNGVDLCVADYQAYCSATGTCKGVNARAAAASGGSGAGGKDFNLLVSHVIADYKELKKR